jgi:hypothetical protein
MQLAPESLGVVGMKWRRASCDKLGLISTTNSQPDSARPANGGKPTASSSSKSKGVRKQSKKATPSLADSASLDGFVAAANLDNPKIEGDHLVLTQREWDALVASSGAGDTWPRPKWLR